MPKISEAMEWSETTTYLGASATPSTVRAQGASCAPALASGRLADGRQPSPRRALTSAAQCPVPTAQSLADLAVPAAGLAMELRPSAKRAKRPVAFAVPAGSTGAMA